MCGQCLEVRQVLNELYAVKALRCTSDNFVGKVLLRKIRETVPKRSNGNNECRGSITIPTAVKSENVLRICRKARRRHEQVPPNAELFQQ